MPEKQKREWDFTVLVQDNLPSYPTKEELEEKRSYNYALPKNFHDYSHFKVIVSDSSPQPANDLFSSKGKRKIQASLWSLNSPLYSVTVTFSTQLFKEVSLKKSVPKPEEYSVGKNLQKRKKRQEQLKAPMELECASVETCLDMNENMQIDTHSIGTRMEIGY
ncbi:hypothetical protein QOT17_008597 [Balamuthia mandrillaris]